jgi:hypothetical protein
VTDSAIELEYEERLKAEQGKLLLYVDGSLKLTEPDTPAGRTRIGKAAFLALETSDDVMVRGEEAGERNRGRARKGNSESPVPASSRRPCCKPEVYPGPSGVRRRHRFDCPSFPGQPYADVTATIYDISQARLSRRHAMESRRTGLDDAIADHPASYVSAETHALIHPGEDALDCLECAERGHPG